LAAAVHRALSRNAALAISAKTRINAVNQAFAVAFGDSNVSKTDQAAQRWTKPELTKLGELKDVAGQNAINANGQSANPLDPAAS
jgi:hypothetical protein